MEFDQYCDAVAANRRDDGFEPIDDQTAFDPMWRGTDTDPTVGDVSLFLTVVDADGHGADDLIADADRFRDVLASVADFEESDTTIGYLTFVTPNPSESVVSAATSYTVADRRTNVFPLVYDGATETLHTHPVPRLKGRGIYRRQIDDAESLFAV